MPTTTAYPNPSSYWNFLHETLYEVFQFSRNSSDASDLLGSIRNTFQGASQEEQLALFHMEPLDVAAIATGKSISPQNINDYQMLVTQRNWKP